MINDPYDFESCIPQEQWDEFHKRSKLRVKRLSFLKNLLKETEETLGMPIWNECFEIDYLFDLLMTKLYKDNDLERFKRESFSEGCIANFFVCDCDGEFIKLGTAQHRRGLEPATMYICATCGAKFGII